jgi:hypothetical protein
LLLFLTSVRHPHNCRSYRRVSDLLSMTLASVCRQDDDRFVVVVVCNLEPEYGSGDGVHYLCVDFPPPSELSRPNTGMEAIRVDRGAKYVAGLAFARRFRPSHVMFFDADDLVSRKLCGFVQARSTCPGWYLDIGYQYELGRKSMSPLAGFHKHCGTSLIVRHDLIDIDPRLTEASRLDEILRRTDTKYLKYVLGSHRLAVHHHRRSGHPLAALPFPGAVWVLGTGENHSGRSAPPGTVPLTPELIDEFSIPAVEDGG